MTGKVYVQDHRPAMGWWDGNGFHGACECGYETGPCAGAPQKARQTAERLLVIHIDAEGERGTIIIEQDAVELPDDPAPADAGFGVFPEGF